MNKINNLEIKINSKKYRKVALAACFGTFLEWYDFLCFAALAILFGPLFFPFSSADGNSSNSLLASLATFGVGMVFRPIGAAFFGSLADRIGRRPVFLITMTLMGGSTLAVGFLPTFNQIGYAAPVLLIILRLLQGLSAGGEIGGSAVYLAEHADPEKRGFQTSFLQLMGPLGILASTLQIAYLQHILSPEAFQEWGWRVPFWVSLLLLIIALKTRLALEETPIFKALNTAQAISTTPLRDNFRDHTTRRHMFLLFFCISAGGSVLFFCVQVYTAIYLKSTLKIDSQLVNSLSIYATCALFPLTIFAGALSDRFGRKPIVIAGLILGTFFILPAFALLGHLASNATQNTFALALVFIVLSLPLALVIGPQSALLAELFPAKRRSSAATLPHNFAAGWIGGLLPLIVTWLNQALANPLAGLWYPTVFLAAAAILAIFYLPETRKINLHY